jgi:type I restriction enzyme S subunit
LSSAGQEQFGWGEAVVETVAGDLQREFPASQSFSSDNLWRMRQVYLAYSCPDFLGQVVPESQRTVAVLSTYDDLIENNRRRMALLEDAALWRYQENKGTNS